MYSISMACALLSIRWGQINSNIVVIFSVSCEEKDYYRAVSVGQLGFDYHSYARRSHFIHDYEKQIY